jgi:hypothetical protein
MKSRIFSHYDATRSDELKQDLEVLASLTADQLDMIVDDIAEIYATPSQREERELRQSLSKKAGVDLSILGHAIDIAEFFVRAFSDQDIAEGDVPDAIADDLVSLELLPEDRKTDLSDFLTKLQNASKAVKEERTRQSHLGKCVPSLKNVEVAIDHRCIFDPEYSFVDEPASYDPKCTGVATMAIIRLGVSDAHQEQFLFQVDRRRLEILMNYLKAAQRQMGVSERYLSLREE